mgnify:CR=1 FL=1
MFNTYKSSQGDVLRKSAQFKLYPHGCNTQIFPSQPQPLRNDSSSPALPSAAGVPLCLRLTDKNYCMPFHIVVRITEGVSATANEESEEEKLRKLCGYYVNAEDCQQALSWIEREKL